MVEFGFPKKLIKMIRVCLTDMNERVNVEGNHSDAFSIAIGLRQGDALFQLLFNLGLE